MIIKLSPQRRDDEVQMVKAGDLLTINGESFDLGVIPDGATLPQEAIDSEWFCGDVTRENGELTLHLLLPHGPKPREDQAFPADIVDPPDGELALPRDSKPAVEDQGARADEQN